MMMTAQVTSSSRHLSRFLRTAGLLRRAASRESPPAPRRGYD